MNKTRSKTKLGIKSSQNQPGDKLLRKKKIKTTRKKDEENILSKDIDVEEEMKEIERLGERRLAKTREAHMNYTRGSIVNLKFKPQKYKGSFMPYHLRWIFNNTVKSNEIVLLQEIEGLENEINRLKKMKVMNREFRKLSNLPYGICTTPCACCKKLEKKKHECTHEFCEPNCSKKKLEQLNLFKDGQFGFHNFLSQQLKKKIASGNKSQIFGVINKEETKPNGTSK